MRVLNTQELSTKITRESNLLESREADWAFDAAITEYEDLLIRTEQIREPKLLEKNPTFGSESKMAITPASLAAVLKHLYAGQKMESLVFDKAARPLFTMLKKNTGFGGVDMPFPLLVSNTAGGSATFANALANEANPTLARWDVDVKPIYKTASITSESILRAQGTGAKSFLESTTLMLNDCVNSLADKLECALFRDGSGGIGTISDVITGGDRTLILSSVSDCSNFVIGQKIVAASSKSASLRSATSGVVAGVDRATGTLTFVSTIASTFDGYQNDTLFSDGDYVSASDRLLPVGLDAIFPAGNPGALYGVSAATRLTDRSRYAGVLVTGDASNIEESIIDAAHDLSNQAGDSADVAFMSSRNFRTLVKSMLGKVQLSAGKDALGGFQGVNIQGPRGVIKCIPSTFCPNDAIYVLNTGTLQLVSMGDPVRLLNLDGQTMARLESSDAMRVRYGSWCTLVCSAPGKNARITL